MAINLSLIQLRGTIGNMVFGENGKVSQKPAPRTVTAVRTLENNAEFKRTIRASKLLSNLMKPLVLDAKDNNSFNRLTSVISRIIKKDTINPRGQRAILDAQLIDLKGFDFNDKAILSSTLFTLINTTYIRASGIATLTIPAHSALTAIAAPKGGTFYKFVGVAFEIDFDTNETFLKSAESPEIRLTKKQVPITDLFFDLTPASTKTVIFGLGIKFYQKVNGSSYLLKNGLFNTFQLVEIALP